MARASKISGSSERASRAQAADSIGESVAVEKLSADAHRYEFFQAVRMLAASRGGPQTVAGKDPREEAVRVTPDPANVFPASDVLRVGPADAAGKPAKMTVGFGGLYGVDAALPATFHERISTQAEDVRPLRDFLDLLSHRPYAQLWRAWARYRPEVRAWSLVQQDVHGVRAAALSGIPKTADLPVDTAQLLPFAARLSGWARNAEGLSALLQHAVGHQVRVLENVPRLVRLAERPKLGTARLGVDAVAGAAIHDHSGKFRLQIGPLGLDAFRDLLPGSAGGSRINDLVQLYMSDSLDYDVDLLLKSAEAPQLRLGDTASARLGRNAHLGKPPPPLVSRRVRYTQPA